MSDRAEFEREAERVGYNVRKAGAGLYFYDDTEMAWELWQAARAQAVPNEHGKNRYGLDMAYFRNLFNRELNRPLVNFRPDELARVLARAARTADAAVLQEPEFQAARAQSGQGTEPVAWMADDSLFWHEKQAEIVAQRSGKDPQPLYTHPQPAQQGSVPDGNVTVSSDWLKRVRRDLDACQTVIWMALRGECDPAYCEEAQARLKEIDGVLAAPQPEGDRWVKCSERLPKLGQRVQLFSQGVLQHMMPVFDEGDEGPFWDFEQDYNPEVNFKYDQWMPLPQPPKQKGE